MIQAEARTDDEALEVRFDAEAWFEQASDTALAELAGCNWGGDLPADGVAEYIAGLAAPYGRRDAAKLAGLFEYLELLQSGPHDDDYSGFECWIEDVPAAVAWLWQQRPCLAARLVQTGVLD